MPRFLDLNTSANATAPFSVASQLLIPVGLSLASTLGQFGGIGLSTQFVAGPTVDLAGSIVVNEPGATFSSLSAVTINIVRNPTSATPVTIYTLTVTLSGGSIDPEIIAFNAQDLSAPAGQLTAYAAYVSQATTGAGTPGSTRLGPETFWGIAADRTTS